MRWNRLRELERINCEGLMRAAGQNLKRLLKKRGGRHRPGPVQALSAFFLAAFEWIARTLWHRGLFPSRLVQMTQETYNTMHPSLLVRVYQHFSTGCFILRRVKLRKYLDNSRYYLAISRNY